MNLNPRIKNLLQVSDEVIDVLDVNVNMEELKQGVYAALETYSNVHRGSGHYSIVTTKLFEQARSIILNHLNLSKKEYIVIFCTARRSTSLKLKLKTGSYEIISSRDIGLPLGVSALAVKRNSLPSNISFHTGGGTTRLVSRTWIMWANAPDRFEAGTPAIINIIAFAKALILLKNFDTKIFPLTFAKSLTASEILYHDEFDAFKGKELLDKLRISLIGRDQLVPTTAGLRKFINLDYAASAPAFLPVWNAFCYAWSQSGQVQQEIVSMVRSVCADAIGASLNIFDIFFTSNTTEAINLVAESLELEKDNEIEPVILISLLEHSSNDLPWRFVPDYSLIRLPVDKEGFIDSQELDTILYAYNEKKEYGKKRIKLVSITAASNVHGVYNNLTEISHIVHRYGAHFMIDAAQLIAHRKIDMEACGIDYLAFSAHKVYAPFGTGVLIARKGLLNFGPQDLELINASGEENVGGITALGKAVILLQRIGLDLIQKEEEALTQRALIGLNKIPRIKLYGINDIDSPRFAQKGGIIIFGVNGIQPGRVAKDMAVHGGIGMRYGCHCAHLLIKDLLNVPPALEKIQRIILLLFRNLSLPGVARISFGIGNSEQDIDDMLDMLTKYHISSGIEAKHTGKSEKFSRSQVQRQIDEFVKSASYRVYGE